MLKLFINYLSGAYPDMKLEFNDIGCVAIQFPEIEKNKGKICFVDMQDEDESVALHCIHWKTDGDDRWFFRRVFECEFNTEEQIKTGIDFMMESDSSTITLEELYSGCDTSWGPNNETYPSGIYDVQQKGVS